RRRDKENFWVIFSLFFMTGIAIVLYVNQPPYQVRDRDYSYAGSFYAFAIWIGMSVPALYRLFVKGEKERPALAGSLYGCRASCGGLGFSAELR
ncbi:hypothetical protein, partial [uncultured Porphyromonas sp.]|uniref:hypothetical protein n=1 Tax=uncultured Porphyromonas sp. TaxID=159274 RepID=UPI002620F92D